MGWLSDFFRLAWGLLYWNARKSFYRLRRGRSACPCQDPSDSGRAWETHCNAVVYWRKASRFRRVCPLLRQDPTFGWRCSANQADVRPFWLRALGFYGAGFTALYLAGTIGAFTLLRSSGYGVTYANIAWPAAWSEFRTIRAEFFFEKFQTAYARGDIREGLLSLSLAYNLDSQNYRAGRLLAQLYQGAQPALSDQVYRRLLAEHPEEAEATAQAFFRSLLARGDFPAIQTLARDRILATPGRASAWLNALFFANQRTGDAAVLDELLNATADARFSLDTHTVLMLAVRLRTTPPEEGRRHLLASAAGGVSGYPLYFICRELLARGFHQDALALLDQESGLEPRDRTALRLDALAAGGWNNARRREVEGLLVAPPTAATVELLSAHLIRRPDPTLLEVLCARLDPSPLPAVEANYPAYLAIFCAAGVNKNEARLRWASDRLKEIIHTSSRRLDAVGAWMLADRQPGGIENQLPSLQPLSLEISYALLSHYSPAPATAGAF